MMRALRRVVAAPAALVVAGILSLGVAYAAYEAATTWIAPEATSAAPRDLVLISGIASRGTGGTVLNFGNGWACDVTAIAGTCSDWSPLLALESMNRYRRVVVLSYSLGGYDKPYEAVDTCFPERAAVNLAQYLRSNEDVTVDIVTHSLGGAAASRITNYVTPDLMDNIHSVVTLSSPIRGQNDGRIVAGSAVFCGFELSSLSVFLDPTTSNNATFQLDKLVDLWTFGNPRDWVVTSEQALGPRADNRLELAVGWCPALTVALIPLDCPAHRLETLLGSTTVLDWVVQHTACDGRKWLERYESTYPCAGAAATPTASPSATLAPATTTSPQATCRPRITSPAPGANFAEGASVTVSISADGCAAWGLTVTGGVYGDSGAPTGWRTGTSFSWEQGLHPGSLELRVKGRLTNGAETAWSDPVPFSVGGSSVVYPPGVTPPPYAPTFSGQTVSWDGNTFRSDDGKTWTFLWPDCCPPGEQQVYPNRFRITSPSGGISFPANQIPTFRWDAVLDDQGNAVTYEILIYDTVSPELRASQGAQRELNVTGLGTNSYTPPASYFRVGFTYEWTAFALSRTDTKRPADNSLRFSVTPAVATPSPTATSSATPKPATGELTLAFERAMTEAEMDLIPELPTWDERYGYLFKLGGIAATSLPTETGWKDVEISDGANEWISWSRIPWDMQGRLGIYMQNQPSGTYHVTLTLPDGRIATTSFKHTRATQTSSRGGIYLGTHSMAGTIRIEVSSDGQRVMKFEVGPVSLPTACVEFPYLAMGDVGISADGLFSWTGGRFGDNAHIGGHFRNDGTVAGIYENNWGGTRPGCEISITWNAARE